MKCKDEIMLMKIRTKDLNRQDYVDLIGILSSRNLGPKSINGVSISRLDSTSKEVVDLLQARCEAHRAAFTLIKDTEWYRDDRWPEEHARAGNISGFKEWVDHRLSTID